MMKVLLVDDESGFLETTARFFLRKGVSCDTATDCVSALELANKRRYDAAVLDMLMPGICGMECMAALQKLQPQLPVIILTGHGSLQSGVQGMQKGAFDYCLKPIELHDLLEKVLLATASRSRMGRVAAD